MSKKSLSPYQNKTLRRAKIQNVKCKLTAYQTKAVDPVSGEQQPLIVFYYEVSATDGSYHKFRPDQKAEAEAWFDNLIEFEKRQTYLRI